MIHNVEEEPRRATPVLTVQIQDKDKGKMVEPEPTLKNPRKAQIQMDKRASLKGVCNRTASLARERIAREKATEQEAKDAALIEQMEDVQARMDADELLAEILQQEESGYQITYDVKQNVGRFDCRKEEITMGKYNTYQLKSKSFEEIQKLYENEQNSKKRLRAEHDKKSVKKQKLEDEDEREELRACLDIVSGDDIAMDFESLAIKYPIIDWKTHILTENMLYYQIIRRSMEMMLHRVCRHVYGTDIITVDQVVAEKVKVMEAQRRFCELKISQLQLRNPAFSYSLFQLGSRYRDIEKEGLRGMEGGCWMVVVVVDSGDGCVCGLLHVGCSCGVVLFGVVLLRRSRSVDKMATKCNGGVSEMSSDRTRQRYHDDCKGYPRKIVVWYEGASFVR
ncbi:hypothetical protein Tco_0080451 [Tanacetum coccineum]